MLPGCPQCTSQSGTPRVLKYSAAGVRAVRMPLALARSNTAGKTGGAKDGRGRKPWLNDLLPCWGCGQSCGSGRFQKKKLIGLTVATTIKSPANQPYIFGVPATAVTNQQQSGQFDSRGSALLASCATSATGRARVAILLLDMRRGLKGARLPAFAVICCF